MRTSDTVVIGGGCVGTSVAYHLAERGCIDVDLLEANELGAGSTSKAAGGIRLQHEDELNIRIALRSLHELENFEELTGAQIDFHQVGYLFLLDNSVHLEKFQRSAELQRALGIETETLGIGEVEVLVPTIRTDDLVGATYCAREGYAAPEGVVQGYASAAKKRGVRVKSHTPVKEIMVDSSGVTGVRTDNETISTRRVVIAAGVGSQKIAASAGVDIPVTAEPRTIFYSGSDMGIGKSSPLVVDFSTGFYFHREGQGAIFAGRQSELDELFEPASHRLPTITEASIRSSWTGDYDMSPDHNALVGQSQVPGLYYATGFSGHGFMQSPAIGEHLSELVLGSEPTIDLRQLNCDRLADGQQRVESFII